MWQARLKIRTTLLEDSRPGHLYKAYSTAKQYCNSKPKNSEELPSFQRRISSKVSKEKIPAKNWRKQSVAADTNKHNASPTLLHSDKEKIYPHLNIVTKWPISWRKRLLTQLHTPCQDLQLRIPAKQGFPPSHQSHEIPKPVTCYYCQIEWFIGFEPFSVVLQVVHQWASTVFLPLQTTCIRRCCHIE